MPEESSGALDIDHADFEWLRAYLQREESRVHENAENDVSDEASDDGVQPVGAKRQKFSFPLMPLTPAEPLLTQRTNSGNSARSLSGTLSNASGDGLDVLGDEPHTSQDGRRRKVGWTSTEDLAILAIFRRLGTQWSVIAAQLPGRTPDAVRNRWHRLQKTHSLGDTEEGRAALDALLLACGISKDWSPPNTDPSQPPGAEPTCIKGSDHGRAMWTAQEDTLIEEGVRRFGCKWREIAKGLPGRSDSSVRNRWMRLQRDRAAARGVDEIVGVPPANAATQERVAEPTAAVPTIAALPPVPESGAAVAESACRPSGFPSLKRAHSSTAGKNSPLGFGSPMLGFDLMSFVDAVSNAVEEDRVTPMLGKGYDALTFEETHVPVTRSKSDRISLSSYASDAKAVPTTEQAAEEGSQPPAGLALLSVLLTGVAALTICASIKAASSARLR